MIPLGVRVFWWAMCQIKGCMTGEVPGWRLHVLACVVPDLAVLVCGGVPGLCLIWRSCH